MSSLKKSKKPRYWRSLQQLELSDEQNSFKAREFIESPSDVGQFSRRRFMQVMGASVALASAQSCRWPRENILPHNRRPGDHIPGVPQIYASSVEFLGVSTGLHVQSYDGRPIKVDGNPYLPKLGANGGSHPFVQAMLLDLYDPDRSQTIVQKTASGNTSRSWDEFAEYWQGILQKAASKQGAGLAILHASTQSPSFRRLQKEISSQYPRCQWFEYEPLSYDNHREGNRLAFGQPCNAVMDFSKAKIVLSLDDNFLVAHPTQSPAYAHAFAQMRRPKRNKNVHHFSRLYVVESVYSTTGAMADHRLALKAGEIAGFLVALGHDLAAHGALTLPAGFPPAPNTAELSETTRAYLRAVSADLRQYAKQSVLTCGPGQPQQVHAMVALLNHALGNQGETVVYYADSFDERPHHHAAMSQLAVAMEHGAVDALLILGGNPVFDTAANLKFADLLKNITHSVHLSNYCDETSQLTQWHVPMAHALESWGDGRTMDGSWTMQQPLIAPLYQGKTALELLALCLGKRNAKGRGILQETFAQVAPAGIDTESQFVRALHDGFVTNSAPKPMAVTPQGNPLPMGATSNVDRSLEVTFWPDAHTFDGRFANNAWLQELPDFISKITWDNAALIHPKTAKKLGVKHFQMLNIQAGERSVALPVFLLPGQPEDSIAISLGYGRREAGRVGGSESQNIATCGFDTYAIWPGGWQNFVANMEVKPLDKTYELATTQDHHTLDDLGRQEAASRAKTIIQEISLPDFVKPPPHHEAESEQEADTQLYGKFDYSRGHRWGMAIDLSACTGCNACVIACQAENNIPVVGKEQVLHGRIMHWMRIDRYFSNDENAPDVTPQPMLCQHCENAPCEQVCPVAATVHTEEGLNAMVYNRCVGTRYCSNNCPYKVRRFNFFNYHKHLENPAQHVLKMAHNPEVTVRSRGVMEKCTYCVQRIQNGKIRAKVAGRELVDGEIVTACQQVCPTQAIVFGDLNDKNSQVAALEHDVRRYDVLAELNTRPRTFYLSKLNNPTDALPTGKSK